MIPRAYITAWRSEAPWQTNEQVEQDLLISRALVEIYQDDILREHLAFRGGTALYKLYLTPAVRYSDDIDLIQIKAGAIGPIFDRLRKKLQFLGKPRRRQRNRNNTLLYRVESEIPPIVPLRLKVEINCREHIAFLGEQSKTFQVRSSWFNGSAQLTTFTLEEILGSKMRALYQRKKGRDLFDLWYALSVSEVDCDKIISSFQRFLEISEVSIARRQFEINLQNKITDHEFLGDTTALLRTDITYDPQIAYKQVMENLISKLNIF